MEIECYQCNKIIPDLDLKKWDHRRRLRCRCAMSHTFEAIIKHISDGIVIDGAICFECDNSKEVM